MSCMDMLDGLMLALSTNAHCRSCTCRPGYSERMGCQVRRVDTPSGGPHRMLVRLEPCGGLGTSYHSYISHDCSDGRSLLDCKLHLFLRLGDLRLIILWDLGLVIS